MPIEFKDGKIVDTESGNPVDDSVISQFKSSLGFFSEDEVKAQVNKVVEGRISEVNEKARKVQQDLITQLEAEKNRAGLTEEEKQGYANRITSLEEELMTAEEREAKKAKGKLLEWEQKAKSKEEEANRYKNMYRDEYLVGKIVTEASTAGAINPNNFVDLLRSGGRETWVDVRDENMQATGRQEPRFKMNVKDVETGNVSEALLELPKAVEILAAENPHLIKGSGQAGSNLSGGYGAANPGKITGADISKMTPSQYAEYKKSNGGSVSFR